MKPAPLALLVLALLAGGARGATTLSDPQDASDPAADLRRIGWELARDEVTVFLDTWARPDTSSWDYVGVLVAGNASEPAPREMYYFSKTLRGGAIVVATHFDNASATPRLSVEGERLRFVFPRVLPANGTAEDCTFALGGSGRFTGNGTSNGTAPAGTLDTVPDGGAIGAGDPWRQRASLCAPPPEQRTPVPAMLLPAAIAIAALGFRRSRPGL